MVHWTYILSVIRFEGILILHCNCFNSCFLTIPWKKKKKKLHSHAILALSATCSFPHFSICHLRHYFIHRSPRNALRISKIHANSSVTNTCREAKFTRNRFWHLKALVRKEMLKNKPLRGGPQHCRHDQARQTGSGQPPLRGAPLRRRAPPAGSEGRAAVAVVAGSGPHRPAASGKGGSRAAFASGVGAAPLVSLILRFEALRRWKLRTGTESERRVQARFCPAPLRRPPASSPRRRAPLSHRLAAAPRQPIRRQLSGAAVYF